MAFNSLQEMLNETYGKGRYLTPGLLTPSTDIIIRPKRSSDFNRAANALIADDLWTERNRLHGTGSVSLGTHDIGENVIPEGFDGAFLYGTIIKAPGQDIHRVPSQLDFLAPVIQKMADRKYDLSPQARDNIGGISLRILPVRENARQTGYAWHAHKPFVPSATFDERAQFFEMTDDAIRYASMTSMRLLQTEFYFSNICPTLVQTAPSNSPLPLKETGNEYLVDCEGDPLPFRQSEPFEIVGGTGCTYHAASTVTSADNGKVRLFLALSYVPTVKAEKEFLEHQPS